MNDTEYVRFRLNKEEYTQAVEALSMRVKKDNRVLSINAFAKLIFMEAINND